MNSPPLGHHFLLDIAGSPFEVLDDLIVIETALVETIEKMGAKILGTHLHRLLPQGISGIVVISESHLTIHTWPERGEAAIDIFSCGDPEKARAALPLLINRLGASKSRILDITRGIQE
jgi:S-adenosylmethionine decarboxylase